MGFRHAKMLAVFLIAISVLPLPARAQQPSVPASRFLTYDEMVQQLKGGNFSIDFTDLRMKYAASPGYDPEAGSDQVKSMYEKLNKNDYKAALAIANSVLDQQYVNIDAHMIASLAYDGLNDKASAEQHHNIAVGLINSILHSGSGASQSSPYVVISIGEEYALMRVLGWMPRKQSYIKEGKRSFDSIEAVDTKAHSIVTVYFDVSLSDQHMEKSLKQ